MWGMLPIIGTVLAQQKELSMAEAQRLDEHLDRLAYMREQLGDPMEDLQRTLDAVRNRDNASR